MRGTIELNSEKEKVFLPELICDIFIGVMKPNQPTIDKDGFKLSEASLECKESDIVHGIIDSWTNKFIVTEIE